MYTDKDKLTAGADERTPSRSEYFSWINSTNEGSTESQTLTNLEYFAYLKRKYNMQLDIYAWDAGNLDGAWGTYETFDSPKIKAQYPNGFKPVADKAAEMGTRMGLWGGPDGFGTTKESAEARLEQMVSLARDLNFALFKFDGVCGALTPENEKYFVRMMEECRRYAPDLILLNHRLNLGEEGMKHATTFLWEGVETYVDVHIANQRTAPHHRGFFMDRGHTPNLLRLTEDHGVCLSSHLDYFEDDLIIQAFSRNLIVAPEIYGNPWFLRDDEHAHLARIFNLHRRYRDILIDGFILPEGWYYPKNTISRGSLKKRFIVSGNQSWDPFFMHLRLDMSIGLAECEKVAVIIHHPFEEYVGEYSYGETIDIEISPYRAILVEICDRNEADIMLCGCKYEVLHEDVNGKIDKVKIVSAKGDISYTDGRPFMKTKAFDNTLRDPKKLGEVAADMFAGIPADSVKQLECALFAQDQDSLEKRSILRSGETKIPEVQAARDAFFNQKTYAIRGPECAYAFDGKDDTFFDGTSRMFFRNDQGFRHDGGCLRIDFGEEYEADYIYFEFFDTDEDMEELPSVMKQVIPPVCDYSTDLLNWSNTTIDEVRNIRHETKNVIVQYINNIIQREGRRRCVTYPLKKSLRYFRMPCPIDHIHKITLIRDGKELELKAPRANNLLPYDREVVFAKELDITVTPEDYREGCYISVGLEGYHGPEGAYAVIEMDGEYMAAPDRAPGYGTNPWEDFAEASFRYDHHYTYYFPVSPEMCGKKLTVRVLGMNNDLSDFGVTAYLCDKNICLDGIEAEI